MYLFNVCVVECRIKRENKRIVAGRIPGLVPDDGSDGTRGIFSNESGGASIGEDCVDHDLVVPCVLQASNALNGDVEAPWEGRVPVRMTMGNIDPPEDAIGDQPGYIFVVWGEGDVRLVATRNRSG